MENSEGWPTRSLAAKDAAKRGINSFECRKVGQGDGHYWLYDIRKEGSVLDYALLWAKGLDFVHHIEMPSVHTHAIAVVTCHPDDVPPEHADELIRYEPLTPSMLLPDGARRKRTARDYVEARDPVATLTYIAGYDLPMVHPITGLPLDEIL